MNTPQQQNRPDTISQANMAAPSPAFHTGTTESRPPGNAAGEPSHAAPSGRSSPPPLTIPDTIPRDIRLPCYRKSCRSLPSLPGTARTNTPGSNSAIQPPHASPTRRPSSPVPLFRATSASTAGTPPAGKRLGPLPPTRSTASPSPATKQAGVSPFPDSPGFRQRSGRLHRNEPGG